MLLFIRLIFVWILEALKKLVPNCFRAKKDVSNDIVLITGGGSGFGRLLALRFAEHGSTVIIWDINEHGLNETKSEIDRKFGTKCFAYLCDVSNRVDVYSKAESVKKDVGNVTILINNAGILQVDNFLSLKDENVERLFKVNILSHFWTCKAFLPSMLNSNSGHIVSIASIGGIVGAPKFSDYCATKAAAISLMESLYSELYFAGKSNINLTTICPVFMRTAMAKTVNSDFVIEPDFAADQTMDAILRNENFVTIPRWQYLSCMLKPILPPKVVVMFMNLLNAQNAFMNYHSSFN
ncbi:epidermal retinol dehydrogenase 2-like protein [Leptotrombidium deliense]|uniref:Short-chain dehydrogenase/reductase 3 n=1 Tax=Leptotrombidium deliense TaxID=299467 RepID=A0A443S3Y3_9ACAR|nr:epidermal retinol dehydrogenase 2-like protein [Leptotrombidium deliense]